MASLSAARWAYMFGCRDTFCMLVAWGRECSEEDTLGKATRLEGAPLFDASREAIARKYGASGQRVSRRRAGIQDLEGSMGSSGRGETG